MRVLQINAVDSVGSTGAIMSDIQDVCTHNGIDCHIAYSTTQRSRHDILNGYHIGCWLDHKLHALLWRIFRKQAYFSTIPTWFLLRHISKIKPDVVHLHNLHSNYIKLNMLLRFLAKKNIPTVATLHDNWFYTGGCYYYPHLNCTQWQHDCANCPEQKIGYRKYFKSPATGILNDKIRLFNSISSLTLVGVSNWIANECRKSHLGRNHILTIRNGVRMETFAPMPADARLELRRQYGILDDQFLILGPASKWLDPTNRQGLQTILDNLREDEVLMLYGCNPIQMQLPLFQERAGVRHLPYITNKVVLSTIYSMADVFINCTHEDTCSFLNLEAQSCGTPIVTFDNTGAAETVDNVNSFRVPTDDYHAILQKVAYIKSLTPAQRAQNQSNLTRWISDNFTMQRNYEQYVQLYKGQIES